MQGRLTFGLGGVMIALLLALPSAWPQAVAEREAGEIGYEVGALPEQVQRTRERIMEAARTGDIEAMRVVIEMNEMPPVFSFGGGGDPIAEWRRESGDGEGREILAIMLDVLEAGYIRLDRGTDHDIYVWPYFYDLPLDDLTPEQQVGLYRLVTPEQHRQMIEFGGYNYYRLGIGPDGTWHFFVAGD